MNLEIEGARPVIPETTPRPREIPRIPDPRTIPVPSPSPEKPSQPVETPKPRVPVPA